MRYGSGGERRPVADWALIVLAVTGVASTWGCSAENGAGLAGGGGASGAVDGQGGRGVPTADESIHDARWDPPEGLEQVIAPPSNAMTCTLNSQCSTGYCVDGFCCDNKCDNKCMACSAAKKGSGVDGVCGSIKYDTDPDNDCPTGACDGKNACKSYNGVSCSSNAHCLSNYCVDGFCCNNICMGSCQACSAAKKGSGSNGVCGSIAANADPDNECTGSQCNGGGACQTAQTTSPNGTACISAAQCASGYCADGVCCDSWCLGTCQSCTAAKKGSGADGTCGNIANDKDPDDECWGGACNGQGSCKQYNGVSCTTGSQCLSNYCVDNFCCGNACTGACSACSTAKKGSGYDGVCGPIANTTDPDNECNPGECNGSGACNQPQTPQANGASCTLGAQCTSGFCVDGFCCESACTGSCKACSAAKKGSGANGACGNIATETDPDNECSGGRCDGTGACRFYNGAACSATNQCFSNYCVDGFCCGNVCASSCMACSTAKKGSGFNGVCGAIAANTDPDNECGAACNGSGACLKAPNGAMCSSAAECTSGFCVDGFCCGTACSGLCETCAAPGAEGTCTSNCPSACSTTVGLPNAPSNPVNSSPTIALGGQFLASADLNADGVVDLVSVDSAGNTVTTLLGQPGGTFASGVGQSLSPYAASSGFLLAKMNTDAFPDLVHTSQGNVVIRFGSGNGTFGSPNLTAASSMNIKPVVGDIDGNGTLDVVTTNTFWSPATGHLQTFDRVVVLLNPGIGILGSAIYQHVAFSWDSPDMSDNYVSGGDFNGDGKFDIAVTGTRLGGTQILLSQGNGQLTKSSTLTGTLQHRAADFNADGAIDLVGRVNANGQITTNIWLNAGAGTFAFPVQHPDMGAWLATGDLNGDNVPDLASSVNNQLRVMLNQGTGTFGSVQTYPTGTGSSEITLGDWNGDGRLDVAVQNASTITLHYNSCLP